MRVCPRRSVLARAWTIAAALVVALASTAGLAFAFIYVRGDFDPTATLANGKITVGGHAPDCPRNDQLRIRFDITQGRASSRGEWPRGRTFLCRGPNFRYGWEETVEARGFQKGSATGYATAYISGKTSSSEEWSAKLTVK